MRNRIAIATLIVLLAQTSLAADQVPADIVAFTSLKLGDKVAVLLPDKSNLTEAFCELVGDAGRVYAISVPTISSAKDAQPAVAEALTDFSCGNVTAFTLQSKNLSAPELYNSSDDPGVVYQYVTQRPPIESFAAPEPLDMIWLAANYRDLRGERFGSPDMAWVNGAFLKALKPGGMLVVAERIETSAKLRAEMIAAGFECVAETKTIGGEGEWRLSRLFKFRKRPES